MIVETTTGAIRGHKRRDALRFAGVPYAAPPVGELRFRPPVPHVGWTGVLDARAVGPMSVQSLRGASRVPVSENCLHLNITAPLDVDAPKPVLVWVHGGGFLQGAASDLVCEGTRLARSNDLVVVTLNYRLGALGWLYLDHLDGVEPGSANNGLLDVTTALRWVHENIAAFGGDPDNVTLAGQSSGAMAAVALMSDPRANPLFHRVIAQSGAAQHTKRVDTAHEVAERVLAELGVRSYDEIRSASAESILRAQSRVVDNRTLDWHRHPSPDHFLAFGPVIDKTVVTEAPLSALRSGVAKDIPLLVGTNNREWCTFGGDTDERNTNLHAGLSALVGDPDALLAQYRSVFDDPREMWGAIMTDATFAIPAIRLAEAHRSDGRDVFMYRFDWERPGHKRSGFHSFELPFVFDNTVMPDIEMVFTGPHPPLDLAQRMSSAWAAFARNGVPAGDDVPAWPAYDAERRTMLIDRAWCAVDDPNAERRLAWDGVL